MSGTNAQTETVTPPCDKTTSETTTHDATLWQPRTSSKAGARRKDSRSHPQPKTQTRTYYRPSESLGGYRTWTLGSVRRQPQSPDHLAHVAVSPQVRRDDCPLLDDC